MADNRNRGGVTVAPANPSIAPKPEPKPEGVRMSRKLSPEEKERRAKELANESKADKFRRLAIYRVSKAQKAIKAIGHLANRAQYEATHEQAEKVCKALADAVQAVKDRFTGNKQNGASFSL